jgi:exodeoxyribonuclease-3
MKSLITFNVNGIRSISNKGFSEFVGTYHPDILSLQEIKANNHQLLEATSELQNEYQILGNSAERPGYSGTAFLVKREFFSSGNDYLKYNHIFLQGFSDTEGRFQILETANFFLINSYYPNGQDDHNRVPFKLDYSFKIMDLAMDLKKIKPVYLCGDFNIAHKEIDLKNPKSNTYSTGFLNYEREFLDQLTDNNFTDCFRHFNPELLDQYTWWSYRMNARERNVGWRLDYFFASEMTKVGNCKILSEVKGSDHCPVLLEILE